MTTAGGGAGSGGATYIYDGEGKRVKKLAGTVTTVFVYNISGQMLAEYSDSIPAPPRERCRKATSAKAIPDARAFGETPS
jgi:hypothetical protein